MLKSTQFSAINNQLQNLIDTCFNLTAASIDGVKKAVDIQCDAYSNLTKQYADAAKSLCSVTNAAEASKCMQELFTKTIEASIAKNHQLSGVFADSHNKFSNATSQTIKEAQQSLIKSVDQLASVSPALSKVASESLQTSISTINSVADTASKVSAQVAEVAKKNIEVATNAALNSAKKVTPEVAK